MPYITRPHAIIIDAWDSSATAHEVIVTDDSPQPVGLVDAHGHAIYRVQDRVPIGFQAPNQPKPHQSAQISPAQPKTDRAG